MNKKSGFSRHHNSFPRVLSDPRHLYYPARSLVYLLISSFIPFLTCGGHAAVSDKKKLIPIKCLHQAYSSYISSIQMLPDIVFEMTDGQKIRWDDGIKKTLEQKYNASDLKDTLSQPYPAFTDPEKPPAKNNDPGRFRNYAFLSAVYGDSEKAVVNNLVPVTWLPYAGSKPLLFNRQNGASQALEQVVRELSNLPEPFHKYLQQPGGTFNYRVIAGTKLLSAHSYGIAIDINPKISNYWRYSQENLDNVSIIFKNRIPREIIDIFERHGFIWGGRWYHYDTMHFEYRPELFCSSEKP